MIITATDDAHGGDLGRRKIDEALENEGRQSAASMKTAQNERRMRGR